MMRPWSGGGKVRVEDNTKEVKQVFVPHMFFGLGPGLEGFMPTPYVYKNQI